MCIILYYWVYILLYFVVRRVAGFKNEKKNPLHFYFLAEVQVIVENNNNKITNAQKTYKTCRLCSNISILLKAALIQGLNALYKLTELNLLKIKQHCRRHFKTNKCNK